MEEAATETTGTARARNDGVDARRVILWLFVVLAVCTAAALVTFLHAMGDCDRDGVPDAHDRSVSCDIDGSGNPTVYEGTRVVTIVERALAGDLAAPAVGWCLLAGIAAKGRTRAWWFAATVPAGLAAAAATFALLLVAKP